MFLSAKSIVIAGLIICTVSLWLPWVNWDGVALSYWSGRPLYLFLYLSGFILIFSGGFKGEISHRGAISSLVLSVVAAMLMILALNPNTPDDPVTPAIGYFFLAITLISFFVVGIWSLVSVSKQGK